MNIKDLKIPIIPFKGDNFVENKEYLEGRLIIYTPISEDNIIYNIGGFCNKILENNTIEILYENYKMDVQIQGVKVVYEVKPNFVYGEIVETLSGTIRQGYIVSILWHGKDNEFKYFIKDLKGKKISRRYSATD